MYLLDSSAIAIMLGKLRERATEILKDKVTLDLANYELGNIIWKECVLKRRIDVKEAVSRAEKLAKILEILRIEKIKSEADFKETMELAATLKLTFYDASYLYVAKSKKLTLVTDDKELNEKAKQANIESKTVNQLLKTIP